MDELHILHPITKNYIIDRFNLDFKQLEALDLTKETFDLTEVIYKDYCEYVNLGKAITSVDNPQVIEMCASIAFAILQASTVLKVKVPKVTFEKFEKKYQGGKIIHAVMDNTDRENPILIFNPEFIHSILYDMHEMMTRFFALDRIRFRTIHELMHEFLFYYFHEIHSAIPRNESDEDYESQYDASEGEQICNDFAETMLSITKHRPVPFNDTWVDQISGL